MVTISIASNSLVLSSALDEISIDSDSSFVDVEILADGKSILYERFWPYAGTFTLWDVSSIIESHMKSSGKTIIDKLEIRASGEKDSSSAWFPVLFCEALAENGAEFNLESNFLSTLSHRRVAPDSNIFCFFYGSIQDVIVDAKYFNSHLNNIVVKSVKGISAKPYDNLNVIELNLAEIENLLVEAVRTEERLTSIDIICGARVNSFIVDASLAYGSTFYFRNCFNCPDFITIAAVTKTKTEVDRSLAVYGSRAVFYDQTNERNYDVESAALSYNESQFIDQLIASTQVYKILPMDGGRFLAQLILISDSQCDISDDDNPDSIKYTWRYADNRMHRKLSSDNLLRIFTDEFNMVYI